MNARSFIDSDGDGNFKAVAAMAIPSTATTAPLPTARVVFRTSASAHVPPSADGAWWPRSRSLADELPGFVDAWPPERGRIHRILYSPPDWDDHPHSVAVAGRRVKTGSFPRDDTHQLTVTLADRTRRVITVIEPSATAVVATRVIQGIEEADQPGDDQPEWDNEGGQTTTARVRGAS